MLLHDWNKMARTLGYDNASEMLDDLYVQKKMSTTEIGRALGVSGEVVRCELHRQKFPIRGKGGANFTKRKLADVSTLEILSSKTDALAAKYGVNYVTAYKEKKRRQKSEPVSRPTGDVQGEAAPSPEDITSFD